MMIEKDAPTKYCKCCGKEMSRKRYNNRLEDLSIFLRRQFCSLSCANTRTDLTKHGFSFRARKFLKKKCEACGYNKKLQAHHIDQDIKNNLESNIQTLCKHCHDFWHTTAKRRGRTIAGKMASLELEETSLQELTDLKPLGMGKSHCVRQPHGES